MTTPAHTAPAEVAGSETEVPWDRIERFVGQLTHDVRNGLNALELQLTFLGEISTDPEAIDEVKRIRGTLSDITRQLQAVRVSTGTISLHKFEYPAKEFFEDLQERFERSQTPAKERLEWKIGVGDALLSVDPEMTMAAFLELLANAAHFGTSDATAMIEAALDGPKAVVKLRETCPEAPTIRTGEWGRTPLQTTRRGAYGLGLFRVRRIIETQGGTFEVEYAAPDRTLISTVTLPLAVLP